MKYKYIGDGAGVVGLPHEVTDEEAEALGVSTILKSAIENGIYVSMETVTLSRSKKRKVAEVESIEEEGQVKDEL
jgi:hypothetical protein